MLRMAIGLHRHPGAAAVAASATSTGSTRSSTSRSRSPPWRAIGTAPSRATSTSSPGRTRRRRRNLFAISIPRGSSLVLTHDLDGLFKGLKDVPPSERPPVLPVFFAFRIMLAIGFFMIAAALVRRVAVVARPPVRDALVPAHHGARLVDRLRRRDRRLGRDRERTPALDRARHSAHRRCDLAGAGAPASPARSRCSCSSTASCSAMGIYYINRLIARGPRSRDRSRRARCRAGP